jgi:hypothetical protein
VANLSPGKTSLVSELVEEISSQRNSGLTANVNTFFDSILSCQLMDQLG